MADGSNNDSDDGYNMLEPWVKEVEWVGKEEPAYEPLWDISDRRNHHDALFSLGQTSRSGVAIEPSPLTFTEIFYPDHLMDLFAQSTNGYAKARLPPGKYQEVNRADILRFFAILYYMGIVHLPAKEDYWKQEHGEGGQWPEHQCICGMSYQRFYCIWRNLHAVHF